MTATQVVHPGLDGAMHRPGTELDMPTPRMSNQSTREKRREHVMKSTHQRLLRDRLEMAPPVEDEHDVVMSRRRLPGTRVCVSPLRAYCVRARATAG